MLKYLTGYLGLIMSASSNDFESRIGLALVSASIGAVLLTEQGD